MSYGNDPNPWAKVRWFVVAGIALLAFGWLLGALGVCPVVKSIWTPSWVLFSGGWCFLVLAMFYSFVDIWKKQRIAFPLIVIGMNSIAAYCLTHVFQAFAFNSLRRVFGASVFKVFGDAYDPLRVFSGSFCSPCIDGRCSCAYSHLRVWQPFRQEKGYCHCVTYDATGVQGMPRELQNPEAPKRDR